MTTSESIWRKAGTLAGKLLAARAFLDEHPTPSECVRADMREIVREASECPPVQCAMIGLAVLTQYERSTGRTVKASGDGGRELTVLRTLVDDLTRRLDAADLMSADAGPAIH